MSLAKTAQLTPSKLDKDLLYIMDEELSVSDEDSKDKDESKGEIVVLVEENEPEHEIVFELPEVPGGEDQNELELVVEEEPDQIEVSAPDKWDWKSLPVSKHIQWLKNMMDNPPSHSGVDVSGIERCISYFKELIRIASLMVRSDIKGELNVGLVEKAREEMHKAIDRLEERLERLNSNKFKKKKKADFENEEGFVKEAQKAAGVYGRIMITVPLLESHVARVIINSVVSAGKDAEDIFEKLAKKYELTLREKVSVIQLLADSGFPIKHREFDMDKDFDASSENNPDFIAQYYA